MGVRARPKTGDATRLHVALRACVSMLCPVVVFGCEPARGPSAPTVSLRMRGTPPDAMVTIDDEPLGSLEFVAAHGVALPPGVHWVTVKAQGYFPWDREVDAKSRSAPLALEVTLTKVPD
jgi:hypothetical protein